MSVIPIETIYFQRKRFLPEELRRYGFVPGPDGVFRYRTDFMDGDFGAELSVTGAGEVSGRVTDNMSGDEYFQIRSDSFSGAYVADVRAAYEALLADIAENCCVDVLFAGDQANRVAAGILRRYGVRPDFPWGQSPYDSAGTFRHADNNKWFALIMHIKLSALLKADETGATLDVMNLKTDPAQLESLTAQPGIYPAYHMNHKMWLTVRLDGTLTDERVLELVDASYRLTQTKPPRSGGKKH